ncbi:DUF1295 domain-containing protein [bacterium]|nr:DUF1295 domain-containing protein [bacterium]MBU1064556.1 DUF1295 domain-containing protein [bacterium]MBU1634412.1 DUF1295 domain-containing protein [bacterium]
MVDVLFDVALVIWIYMSLFFLLAMFLKDNSIVDIGWGPGFILITLLMIVQRPIPGMRGIAYVFVILWGFRLARHIFLRNRGRREDFRYAAWRKEWGNWFVPRSYLQIFMLQGIIMLIVVYPIVVISVAPLRPIGIIETIGVLIWLIGFYFEAVGDFQLSRFKKDSDNKGKIITSGLWKYTRHPNYFGKAAMWWGIFLLALPVQHGWTTVISPILITYLLTKVSGVPMLERGCEGNVQFELYKQRTNTFFPWFPKKPQKDIKNHE